MSEAVLHFFGGKGGSGKTTLSTAFALNLVEDHPKDKVLLVSIEPVRALTDLIKKKLGPKPSKIVPGKGEGGLFAAELEPASLLEAFVKSYKPALAAAASAQKGALVSADDLAKIFEQTIPGLEEFTALLQLCDWLQNAKAEGVDGEGFDRIVVDSSGSAHVMRLFDIPVQLRKFLALARGDKPGKKPAPASEALKLLDEVIAKVDRVIATLR